MAKNSGSNTSVIHDGTKRSKPTHSITTPIINSAPFTFENTDDLNDFMFQKVWGGGTNGREGYGRDGNLTVLAVENRLAALEGGEDAALFPSGMNALTTLLLSKLHTGDHIILFDDCYKHSRVFCMTTLKRMGVETTIVPVNDFDAITAAIRPQKTRFIIAESPTNPLLRITDFAKLVALASNYNIETIIDSTFGTPVNQKPLSYGIDYVMHSVTKYIGGHHDLVAGVIISNQRNIRALKAERMVLGGVLAPQTAFLIERGIRTLALRMQQHNHNALAVAEFMEQHPKIQRVWYPGLESHPDHVLASQQMNGAGGVVSFEVVGDLASANCLMDNLTIPYIAVSLGGVESLIGSPAIMAYYELEPEDRENIGIKDNLIRFAAGIEDSEDLIADFEQALDKL